QPVARAAGTTMLVEGLFDRFPARKKFLRAPSAEASACISTLQPLALAYPDVQFTAIVDGRESLRTPGSGSLRDAAVAVLGADAADYLIDLPATVLDDRGVVVVSVDGICAAGSYHRAGRSGVTILVNRRPVANRTLSFAVSEAYGSLVPVG